VITKAAKCVLVLAGLLAGVIGAAPAVGAADAGAKSPFVVGLIASETNPQNPAVKNTTARQTLNAWAKTTKEINGHKIVVKVRDDGTDPAKASAAVRDLIENEHVVALVAPATATTNSVWLPIAAAAKVPVVGGQGFSIDWGNSSNIFPVTTGPLDGVYAAVADVKKSGAKKFGITFDSASPAAAAAAPIFKKFATDQGLEWSSGLGVSSTSPDFTAQCITFKQAGTDAIGIMTGAVELPRMARDCARQGYYPTYLVPEAGIASKKFLNDPNIKKMVGNLISFPVFETGTPALDTFHQAMDRYAPAVLKGDYKQYASGAWVSAKLFEAAAQFVTADSPTAQDIVSGLYQVNHDDLGGLAPQPITFTAGAEANPALTCWFNVQLRDHKLIAPDGMKPSCKT
jgi:branched-chain amino acid transport system substrate-binding protein